MSFYVYLLYLALSPLFKLQPPKNTMSDPPKFYLSLITDIRSVAVSRRWWRPADPEPGPLKWVCVQDSQVVQVAGPQLRPLLEPGLRLLLRVEVEPALHDQIAADLNRRVSWFFKNLGVPYRGEGTGPVQFGCSQAMTSRSRM